MSELSNSELRRVHAVNMAIAYYRDLAKTRLVLPKRDDADLAVEIKPDVDELMTVASAFEGFIWAGTIPKPMFSPDMDLSEGGA